MKIPLIIRNISFITISQVIVVFSGLFLLSYLGRVLGPDSFGLINFGLSVYALATAAINLGLPTYGIRVIASGKRFDNSLVNRISHIRFSLASITVLVIGTVILFCWISNRMYWISWLFMFSLLPSAFILDWVYNGLEKMEIKALLRIITSLGVLVLCIFFVHSGDEIVLVPLIYLLVAGITALVSWICLKYVSKFESMDFLVPTPSYKKILKMSLPVGITQILSIYILNCDLLLVAVLTSPTLLGQYSASSRILATLVSIITLLFIPLFPAFCRMIASSQIDSEKILLLLIKLVYVISYPVVCVIVLFGNAFISVLYGPQYLESMGIFAILIWYVPIALITNVISWFLLAIERDGAYLKIIFLTVLVMTCLVVTGTYILGITGAAVAIVLSYSISMIFYYLSLFKVIQAPMKKEFIIISCTLLVGVMLVIFSLSYQIPLLYAVLGAMCSFLVSVVFTRFITIQEVKKGLFLLNT